MNPAFESLARQARSRTLVMGIVNLTPDSFFDGGRNQGLSAALATAREMAQAGADLLDLGGESTRPGAPAVPLHEEMARVRPLAEALAKELPGVAWSIDTTKPQIAAMALDLGACLVNDQDACADPAMARLVAERGCGICLMHRLGSAQGMAASPQEQSHYSPFGVVAVVTDFLQARAAALQAQGVERAAIWLHLRVCAACAAFHRGLRALPGLARGLLGPAGPPPAEAVAALEGALRRLGASRR